MTKHHSTTTCTLVQSLPISQLNLPCSSGRIRSAVIRVDMGIWRTSTGPTSYFLTFFR